ncbi:MAG: hypothetical protein ACR2MG_07365 [Pyrinomonadaceae bacterium]
MLSILGFIAVFIATYFVYKTAKDTGRNAAIWGLLTFAVGFGIQIILPLLIGIIFGFAMAVSGSSVMEIQADIQSASIIIAIVCLILSFIGIALIMRHVAKIPEEKSFVPPPSPPNFN